MSDSTAIIHEEAIVSNVEGDNNQNPADAAQDQLDCVTGEDDENARNVQIGIEQERRFVSNAISTAKYNLFTFIPRFLFEQFRKYSNMFFLIVALLQQIPNVSPTGRFTTVIPLSIILCVSALKEMIEDIKRHRADQRINQARVDVVRHVSRTEGTGKRASVSGSTSGYKIQSVRWMDVKVGDVVRVVDRHFFPADLVLLSSSEPQGMCYIETANLDGETNLKIRQANPRTTGLTTVDDLSRFLTDSSAAVECEPPNTRLYEFVGTLTVDERDLMHSTAETSTGQRTGRFALSSEQLLPRGSMLRNTGWIFGVAVYTGDETKVMLNSTHAPLKRSTLERQSNTMVLFLLCCVAFLTFTCAIGQTIWTWEAGNQYKDWYLPPASTVPNFAFMLLTSFIMFHTLVPISLQVTLEMVRFAQSFFINWDAQMYDPTTDTPAAARTSNLNEELGQIKYIFSDKTGTLTRNMMEFRKCTIGGVKYGDAELEEDRQQQQHQFGFEPQTHQLMPINERTRHDANNEMRSTRFSETRRLSTLLHGGSDPGSSRASVNAGHQRAVRDFVEMMAVCHTVVPEHSEEGSLRYLASSPDEGALVRAAASLGYVFSSRSPDSVTIDVNNNGGPSQSHKFEILNVIEFTSARKRMSAIVRTPDGRLRLLLKGADDAVFSRLAANQRDSEIVAATRNHLEQFASTGLRTLCFAIKDLSEADYNAWSSRFVAASTAISQREERIAQCAELIERDLQLLGATAIEDRLQDEVPETIAALLEASIRLWVLTGDKQETAINIGYASRLIDTETSLIVLNCNDSDSLREALDARTVSLNEGDRHNAATSGNSREQSPGNPSSSSANLTVNIRSNTRAQGKRALVIDGGTLRFALGEEHRRRFLALALECSSVICCRVSPLQKAEIVQLVRANVQGAVTLAIGDGANDVGMIQAAHVGVGISGVEGLQAACASDYAIAQFRFLKRLLLVHGAWNYTRMCKLILYSFYKNACMYITQFWFAFINGFSGQILFDSVWIALYNVIFTSAPPLALGFFERHCSDQSLMRLPRLYTWSQNSEGFNFRLLLTWLLTSIVHSLVIYFMTTSSISHDVLYPDGQVGGSIMYSGNYIMTFIILVVCFKAGLELTTWDFFSHLAIWGSIAWWFVLLAVYSNMFPLLPFAGNMVGMDYQLFSCPSYWLLMFLTPFAALMIDISFKVFRKSIFGGDLISQIQDYEAFKKRPVDIDENQLQRAAPNYSSLSTLTLVTSADVPAARANATPVLGRVPHNTLTDELTDDNLTDDTFRGFAFSQEERGVVSQAEYIRRYESDAAKPSGN